MRENLPRICADRHGPTGINTETGYFFSAFLLEDSDLDSDLEVDSFLDSDFDSGFDSDFDSDFESVFALESEDEVDPLDGFLA
jgi:hypothetical protein